MDDRRFPVTKIQSSPPHGEGGVAITREIILRLSRPLHESTLVDNNCVSAEFAGEPLPARIHLTPDRRTIILFYENPLPAVARIRVTVAGDLLIDDKTNAVDADGDQVAGGTGIIDFDTLSLSIVSNTIVCGHVFASERVFVEGINEWFNRPLAGVTITVDGQEDTLRPVTDTMGNFRSDPAPAGEFFVHIDGTTATNDVSLGAYYPVVGKSWEAAPGEETNIGEIYLPLIVENTLKEVSETEDTTITFPETVLANSPELA